jgi:hypothetical protein
MQNGTVCVRQMYEMKLCRITMYTRSETVSFAEYVEVEVNAVCPCCMPILYVDAA